MKLYQSSYVRGIHNITATQIEMQENIILIDILHIDIIDVGKRQHFFVCDYQSIIELSLIQIEAVRHILL